MLYAQLLTHLQADDPSVAYEVITRQKTKKDISELKKQWDAKEHAIFDTSKRPDKTILEADSQNPNQTRKKLIPVARIPVPLQKMIVGKAVSFLFGNPVVLSLKQSDEEERFFTG